MKNLGVQKRSYAHLMYALISFACPFIAFGICLLYLDNILPTFTSEPGVPIDDADKNAAAMMAGVVVAYLVIAIGTGSLVGLAFALLSLWKRRRFISFGTFSLLFNLLPILGIAYMLIFRRKL